MIRSRKWYRLLTKFYTKVLEKTHGSINMPCTTNTAGDPMDKICDNIYLYFFFIYTHLIVYTDKHFQIDPKCNRFGQKLHCSAYIPMLHQYLF